MVSTFTLRRTFFCRETGVVELYPKEGVDMRLNDTELNRLFRNNLRRMASVTLVKLWQKFVKISMQVQRKEYLVTRPHKRIGNGRASVNVCKRKQQKSEQRPLNSFVPDTAEHDRTTFCPVSLERRKKSTRGTDNAFFERDTNDSLTRRATKISPPALYLS